MLRAVRSALIAADSAGSGLFRTHEESGRTGDVRDHIRRWIADAFDPAASLDEAKVHAAVIDPRIEEQTPEGRPFPWNEFQEACADPARVPARALLIAPCGSGKTLAAWRWVAARCRERPIARAIFLYPTRGTATEGFRDYVSHAGPELAALVHGTAELDLEHLQPDRDLEDRIAEARLFSLRQWPKRVFSATVDQFLAFLQHDYGSTCLLPLLADSAVVLDEVHSYDRGMFTALMQFLEHFDVPVLAMTATMIERRKADLAKHLDGRRRPRVQRGRLAPPPDRRPSALRDRDGGRRRRGQARGGGGVAIGAARPLGRQHGRPRPGLARGFADDPRAERLKTHGRGARSSATTAASSSATAASATTRSSPRSRGSKDRTEAPSWGSRPRSANSRSTSIATCSSRSTPRSRRSSSGSGGAAGIRRPTRRAGRAGCSSTNPSRSCLTTRTR